MKRRFLSMLMVLATILCLVPMTAFATGEEWEEVSTLSALLDAFKSDGNIRLMKALNFPSNHFQKYTISKNVNLDLNGCTVDFTDDTITIADGGTLTVSDSKGGGSIVFDEDHSNISIAAGGSLMLNSGTICRSGGNGWITNAGTFTMNGGTLKVRVDNSSLFYLNGGEINTGSEQAIINRYRVPSATIYVNGGTVTSSCESAYAHAVQNSGTLAVEANREGATFNCTVSNSRGGTICGGTFKGNVRNNSNKEGRVGTITGGTFDGAVENRGIISGGTFTNTVNNEGTIYATANVTGTGSITYNKNNGSVVTYNIGDNEYAEQFVETNATTTKPTAPTREGYIFDGWYTDKGRTAPFDFDKPAVAGNSITLYANFRETAHKSSTGTTSYRLIHTYVEGEGSVDPSGTVMVRDGSDKTFTLTPAAGYEVGDVVVNHKSLGAVTSFTLKDIDTDTSVEVTFVKTGNAVVGMESTKNPTTGAVL